MGIGPYALCGTPGRRTLRVVAESLINCPGELAHSGALAAVGARDGAGIVVGGIPKGGDGRHDCHGQRLAKRKARKEKLVKSGLCPTTSECSTAYTVRKSEESPARAPVGAALIEQDRLEPRPAAREGAPRP